MGGGGGDTSVTTATANPKVPKGFEGLAEMLKLLSSGMLASPTNFGPTGLDAPAGGALVPQPSMGSLFGSTPYQMGANRRQIGGGNRTLGTSSTTAPKSWGDLFTRKPPVSEVPTTPRDRPYRDSQDRLAANI